MSELMVRGVTKSFGSARVLTGVDLTVPEGTLTAVLGASGCGKTTLLRIVAGFVAPDGGAVSIGGKDVTGLPPERRRIGIVPQEGALFPHLTVAGNVGFGLRRGSGSRVDEMLELVGLSGYGNRMPHELSGGQQQRVALARALAPRPALVLLDEPFSALDTSLRAAVRADVRTALHAAGATAVLVTHDQQEALSMADLVAVLRDGRIVQSAPPDDLYARPVDLQVANFVGEAVVLPAKLTGSRAECLLGLLPVHNPPTPATPIPATNGSVAGGHATNGHATEGPARDGGGVNGHHSGAVLLRPEQLVVTTPENGVKARVLDVEFFGHDALIHLDLPGSAEPVRARTLGHQRLVVDDEVGITVDGSVSFFPG